MVNRLLFALSLLVARPALARVPVQIVKHDAVVERRTFDPKHPPAEMPPLKPREEAVTEFDFAINCGTQYGYPEGLPRNGRTRTTVVLQSVRVDINLKVVIWLPEGANKKLKAHEEGHRQIAEDFYVGAEPLARAAAELHVRDRLPAEGSDSASAAKAAVDLLIRQVNNAYLAKISRPCGDVQDEYDRLTDHGRNRVPEAEAIQRARAATRPAPTAE